MAFSPAPKKSHFTEWEHFYFYFIYVDSFVQLQLNNHLVELFFSSNSFLNLPKILLRCFFVHEKITFQDLLNLIMLIYLKLFVKVDGSWFVDLSSFLGNYKTFLWWDNSENSLVGSKWVIFRICFFLNFFTFWNEFIAFLYDASKKNLRMTKKELKLRQGN